MIWFTADTHFAHNNILIHCERPFKTATEMDLTMLTNINEVVGPDDTLYHLGDFAFRHTMMYREGINCKHVHLIQGNHDKKIPAKCFESVSHYKEVKTDACRKIVLCHYAMRVWNCSHHGSWQLYGHSHGSLPDEGRKSFDVGVDCWDYRPLSLDMVAEEMERRVVSKIDHHGPETP